MSFDITVTTTRRRADGDWLVTRRGLDQAPRIVDSSSWDVSILDRLHAQAERERERRREAGDVDTWDVEELDRMAAADAADAAVEHRLRAARLLEPWQGGDVPRLPWEDDTAYAKRCAKLDQDDQRYVDKQLAQQQRSVSTLIGPPTVKERKASAAWVREVRKAQEAGVFDTSAARGLLGLEENDWTGLRVPIDTLREVTASVRAKLVTPEEAVALLGLEV